MCILNEIMRETFSNVWFCAAMKSFSMKHVL